MLKALIQSMRPKQWVKNVFVLAALVFDRQLTNWTASLTTLLGVFLFCMLSSSVYLINDVADKKADQNHPTKKDRPIASGKLPVQVAISVAIIIMVVSLWLAFRLSTSFGIISSLYFLMNLAYSFKLKHIPLIDVMIIATGFVLRVAAGVSLIEVERFSPWLYVTTTLLALFIGFGKRRAEIACLNENANQHRKVLDGYTLEFLDQLITIVSSATIMTYSLYTFSAPNLPQNNSMMLTIPFVLYGLFRYLYLIKVQKSGGAPEELILSDKPLHICVLCWGVSVLVIFYWSSIVSLF
ncbi:MAG TPA: decaprenyl-phosphate phosphoribosyltransferase [Anaerolineaceae bacterium]|uniref:Putative prenyltransferase n=1 Tax=Anaerolinea thermophila TaxID=167964 RepID=A0A101FXI0_9CHLR|nr:MAG: Putative prenyltransferase [Anaerolinea thermophila]HAF62729.1 decaprenyl-phosphate phosphoribosyltransferase [Anaerolineaceae bacterium]